MRKVILLFTILFLVLLSAGATVTVPEGSAGSASFNSSSEGTITDVKAYLKATFNMDDESNQYDSEPTEIDVLVVRDGVFQYLMVAGNGKHSPYGMGRSVDNSPCYLYVVEKSLPGDDK